MLIVWVSEGQDGRRTGIYGRRYSSYGSQNGGMLFSDSFIYGTTAGASNWDETSGNWSVNRHKRFVFSYRVYMPCQ